MTIINVPVPAHAGSRHLREFKAMIHDYGMGYGAGYGLIWTILLIVIAGVAVMALLKYIRK
jgi:hypothetical protein